MTTETETEVLTSYKAFNSDLVCHPNGGTRVQYEVGKEYKHKGTVAACKGGFHACEYPLDVFRYYSPATSRFAIVEQYGTLSRHSEDTKVASQKIRIKAEIGLPGIIKAAVDYTLSRCKPIDPNSPAFNKSEKGQATNSGNYGASTNSGYRGASTNSGNYGASTNSGYRGASTNSGNYGASTNSGYRGASTNSGNYGASTNSGEGGASTNSGNYGASTNSGEGGASTNSGNYGASTNSGNYGASTNTGLHGVAMSCGIEGKVRGSGGSVLFLVERDYEGKTLGAWHGIVGQEGVKADTWYSLINGELKEVE